MRVQEDDPPREGTSRSLGRKGKGKALSEEHLPQSVRRRE